MQAIPKILGILLAKEYEIWVLRSHLCVLGLLVAIPQGADLVVGADDK